jgi:hypothetical protein
MKVRTVPARLDPDTVSECPGDIGEAVGFLRGRGLSKVQSIAVIADRFGLPLDEAKRIVHFSDVWSDVRDRDEQLHDGLHATLSALKS